MKQNCGYKDACFVSQICVLPVYVKLHFVDIGLYGTRIVNVMKWKF